MASEPKKISFGFSKINKKQTIAQVNKLGTEVEKVNNEIEFIDCLEGTSIKVINGENDKEKKLPVIPMRIASTLRENMLETINSRKIKSELKNESNGITKENNEEKKPLTLDELAEKELLEGAHKTDENQIQEKKVLEIPSNGDLIVNEKESTLDDYDNMPITDFGLAMLRGMGWDEKKGIGLNEKIVQPAAPAVRPKGMGLGADKALLAKNQTVNKNSDLTMKKGACVKIIRGPHVNSYGKVEGFDELPGRIIVKLSLSNINLSLSEFMVELIPLSEYNKNSKVMNLDKYNEFSSDPISNKESVKITKDKIIKNRKPYSSSDSDTKKNVERQKIKSKRNFDPREKYSEEKRTSKKYSKHRSTSSSPDNEHKRNKGKSKSKNYSSVDTDSSDYDYKKSTNKHRRREEVRTSRNKKYKNSGSEEERRSRRREESSDYSEAERRRKKKEDKSSKRHKKSKRRHRSRS